MKNQKTIKFTKLLLVVGLVILASAAAGQAQPLSLPNISLSIGGAADD
jgi:hypothetical protein